MKKAVLFVCIITMCCFIASCSGGSSGTQDDGKTVAEKLAEATDQLADGDVSGAEATYTAIIGSAAASVARETDANNAKARFGRALCNLLLLMENPSSDAILQAFGESPWQTTDVFGANGYFALSLTNREEAKLLMPFHELWNAENRRVRNHRGIVRRMQAGYTGADLIAEVDTLMVALNSIIADLEVAILDADASFTIPKAMYAGDADIPINHADMLAILSGLYAAKAGSNFANSWTFDMDFSDLVDENGNSLQTAQEIVNRLNAQFALKTPNQLSTARTNLFEAFTYSKQALDEILSGSSGGVLNLSEINQPMYEEMLDMANAALESFDASTAVPHLVPEVMADLKSFFDNPPNIESDPFVAGGRRKIEAVESYWQQMINSACDYEIGTRGVKMFSSAVLSINRPFYQLFGQVMGHTYGRHRAGRGASQAGGGSAGM